MISIGLVRTVGSLGFFFVGFFFPIGCDRSCARVHVRAVTLFRRDYCCFGRGARAGSRELSVCADTRVVDDVCDTFFFRFAGDNCATILEFHV